MSEATRLEIAAATLAASTAGAAGDDMFLVDTAGGLGLNHVNAGSGDVFLTALGGSLTDANAGDPNVTAGRAALVATGGIGSGDALETAVAQLAASNAASGNIELANTGALAIVTVGGTSGVTSPASVIVVGDRLADDRRRRRPGILAARRDRGFDGGGRFRRCGLDRLGRQPASAGHGRVQLAGSEPGGHAGRGCPRFVAADGRRRHHASATCWGRPASPRAIRAMAGS